ncbi:hypothetical protein A7O95_07170 [Listeria monocytogenes]|nr:hypothetical protein [Listeria monocytogenes]EAD4384205.1 hypothetical protein [Listeria monocytogenes]EAD4387259.1 hypothetical protein [Listeria monocytogenes]OEP00514.1 hypothetical protein AJZ92_04190 [Listeria monocytogenes]PCT87633.1 hypothetical protein A7O96_04675 [Listeria monocytogenes]
MNNSKTYLYLSLGGGPYVLKATHKNRPSALDEAEALISENKRNKILLTGPHGHEYLYRGCPRFKN